MLIILFPMTSPATSVTPSENTHMSAAHWRSLILLILSVGINYIDRGSLSIAAPILQKEMGLTPEQLGLLFSAFFWTYASFQIVAGWLVDRYSVNLVFGIGFMLWSCATAATGMVTGFAALLVLRILLGAGESVAYPAYSKILATGFPERHRGLTNGLIDAGSKCGPAIGTLLGGLLVAKFGWRFLFLALGLGSLPWLIGWALWAPKPIAAYHKTASAGPSAREILTRCAGSRGLAARSFPRVAWPMRTGQAHARRRRTKRFGMVLVYSQPAARCAPALSRYAW